MDITVYTWQGKPSEGKDVTIQNLNELEVFIKGIGEMTDLVMNGTDSKTLTLSKMDGKYNVTFIANDKTPHFFLVTGQEKSKSVDYRNMLTAAKYFFDYSEMNPELTWISLDESITPNIIRNIIN